jgi:hypothetical protein
MSILSRSSDASPATGILLALLLLVGCGGGDGDELRPEPSDLPEATSVQAMQPDPLDSGEAALAESHGAPVADALAQGLVGPLTRAIDERGLDGAVAFCHAEAMALTAEATAGMEGVEVKRTTLRWRNPENAPDAHEERLLRYLEGLESAASGSAPSALTAAGPEGTLRYYRVLRTGPMCLGCHGDEAGFSPELARTLAQSYPEDQATGYVEGAFRGVIRVQVDPARVQR